MLLLFTDFASRMATLHGYRRAPTVMASTRDALTVTVLDRSNSSNEDHDAFVAEAEPLLCTEWGLGARPVLRSCIVAPTEQHQPSIPQRLPSASTGVVREGAGRKGRVAEECAGTGRKHGGTSTIQLNICWSPKVRLRKPLSFLSDAGSRTWMLLSGKARRVVEWSAIWRKGMLLNLYEFRIPLECSGAACRGITLQPPPTFASTRGRWPDSRNM